MTEKTAPLGICDHCGQPIPLHLGDRTSKGKPRLYCSRDCQNTANSRNGNPTRVAKLRQAIEAGQWQNPHLLKPPTGQEQARRAQLGRRREVEAGTWRNPALDEAAREKLSRPRKHGDNPILHSAIEKLRRGFKMNQLSPEEQITYRTYQRRKRAELKNKTPGQGVFNWGQNELLHQVISAPIEARQHRPYRRFIHRRLDRRPRRNIPCLNRIRPTGPGRPLRQDQRRHCLVADSTRRRPCPTGRNLRKDGS